MPSSASAGTPSVVSKRSEASAPQSILLVFNFLDLCESYGFLLVNGICGRDFFDAGRAARGCTSGFNTCALQSSARGLERNCFTRERRVFSSSVRWRAARVRRVGTRFAGRWFRRAASSRSLRRQVLLLRWWLRSSRHDTTIPLGTCLRRTPVSTL